MDKEVRKLNLKIKELQEQIIKVSQEYRIPLSSSLMLIESLIDQGSWLNKSCQ